ncbi:nucleotidyltransferase family protein [Cellulosimicrobium sp. NPDC057127]|uniref:nucleotidyltransferase family protein n=1 Tax=Cellulosimicrobium sp. NPDC057127 TaxID=3346026 RepID=UPI0036385784
MSAVEDAFARYLEGAGARADTMRAEAGATLERAVRQAHDLGWSQRRTAVALGRSQPEVKRLLDRALSHEGPRPSQEHRHGSVLDDVLRVKRDEVVEAAARHGARHVRVFGSVAAGGERPDSDVDLLVDLDDRVGLFGLGALQAELEQILGRPVDVVPERTLRDAVRATIEAIPL